MTLVKKRGDQKIEETGFAQSFRAAFKARKKIVNLDQTDKTSQDILPKTILDVTKAEDVEEPPSTPEHPKNTVQAAIKGKNYVGTSLTRSKEHVYHGQKRLDELKTLVQDFRRGKEPERKKTFVENGDRMIGSQ